MAPTERTLADDTEHPPFLLLSPRDEQRGDRLGRDAVPTWHGVCVDVQGLDARAWLSRCETVAIGTPALSICVP